MPLAATTFRVPVTHGPTARVARVWENLEVDNFSYYTAGETLNDATKRESSMYVKPPLLSARQQQLVRCIQQLTAARDGLPPSIREIASAMQVHPSRVQQLARSTQAKGAISRDARTARSWRILLPADATR